MKRARNAIDDETIEAAEFTVNCPSFILGPSFIDTAANNVTTVDHLLGTDALGNVRQAPLDALVPQAGIVTVNLTVPHVVSPAAGSYFTYTSVTANTFGISIPAPGSPVIRITRPGIYNMLIVPTIECGAAPEVPCSIFIRERIDGVVTNNSTVYSSGGIGGSRTPRHVFVHHQITTGTHTIEFEVQGDSLPNGTAVNVVDGGIFISFSGVLP